MKNKYFFCFAILLSNILSGQTPTQKSIDSLWTIATDKNAYLEKGSKEMLRLCTEIYYQSKNINYEKGELRALVKMSEVYINEQNYEEGLKKISEGLLLAEKTDNYVIWSDLLRLQSSVYPELGYYKKADQSARKALHIADKIVENDRRYLAKANAFRRIAENIDEENTLKNKYDSVQFYFYKAYVESKKISPDFPRREMYIAKNVKNIATVLSQQNKISEAEKYLTWYEILTKKAKKNPEYISYNILKGNLENKKGNYKQALEYFNNSIQLSQNYKILPSDLMESYSGISESYGHLKDYKNEALYAEKAKKINDSLSSTEKRIVEKVAKSEQGNNTEKPKIWLWIGLITLLLIVLSILFFIHKRKKIKNTSFEIQKNEIPERGILQSLEKQPSTDSQALSHIIELAQTNDPSFYLKFSELFPNFNSKLLEISSQLTPSDLEYCAFMKLNFDTKQIATFKRTSVSSVESRKYRIRKKLNINSSDNIYTWLMKIQ